MSKTGRDHHHHHVGSIAVSEDSPEFFGIERYGFPKVEFADHPREPNSVPEYLSDPHFQKEGYHVEELSGGVFWVTSGGYDCSFVVTGSGVIAIDAPPSLGENVLAAVADVTDESVTHLVYSHWHTDHIGAGSMFGDVEIIAHDLTRELLERFPDPHRPVPTETFSDTATLDVGGVKLELAYKGANHCPGNIFIYAPAQRVLTMIDIVTPGSTTFLHCDASENIAGFQQAHDQILEYDFDKLVGGHFLRWGTRDDVRTAREYWQDMQALSDEAVQLMSMRSGMRGFTADHGYDELWASVENCMNSMTNYVTKGMIEKTTSTGQTWAERLDGVTTMTKYHAYTVVEQTRLERNRPNYRMRGDDAPDSIQ